MQQPALHPPQSWMFWYPQFSHSVETVVIMHSAKNSRNIPDGREKVVLLMPQRNYKACNNHIAPRKWKMHCLANCKTKGPSDKLAWFVSATTSEYRHSGCYSSLP